MFGDLQQDKDAIWLKLDGDFQKKKIVYWLNHEDITKSGYYRIVDDTRKKDNMYLCIKEDPFIRMPNESDVDFRNRYIREKINGK